MKRIIPLIAALLLATPVMAQPAPQQPDPQVQALGQTVMELTGQKIELRAQLIAAEARVKALEAAAANPPQPAPTAH